MSELFPGFGVNGVYTERPIEGQKGVIEDGKAQALGDYALRSAQPPQKEVLPLEEFMRYQDNYKDER